MRSKEYLSHVKRLAADCTLYGTMNVLSSNKGITTRDRWDATRCDLLLVNLIGATTVSIGTVLEIAWADLSRTPIVCAIEPDGNNPHHHGMLNDIIGFRVPTLTEAVDIAKAILLPSFSFEGQSNE